MDAYVRKFVLKVLKPSIDSSPKEQDWDGRISSFVDSEAQKLFYTYRGLTDELLAYAVAQFKSSDNDQFNRYFESVKGQTLKSVKKHMSSFDPDVGYFVDAILEQSKQWGGHESRIARIQVYVCTGLLTRMGGDFQRFTEESKRETDPLRKASVFSIALASLYLFFSFLESTNYQKILTPFVNETEVKGMIRSLDRSFRSLRGLDVRVDKASIRKMFGYAVDESDSREMGVAWNNLSNLVDSLLP